MQEIGQQVALVSGGSRGIGRATVLQLAEDGYHVAFCYQASTDAADQLIKEVSGLGGTAVATQVDVTDADAVRHWIAQTEADAGPVGLVVTSAGIVRDAPLVMMQDADWHEVIGVNLNGTFNVCRAAIFAMMKRKSGCLVNISSVAGIGGNAGQCNYSASKSGIIGFTLALAKEAGRYGIRANVVAPGFIDTDMTSGLYGKVRDGALASIPLGRFGQAAEVAHAVVYLAGANYVTGAVLRVDGGMAV